MSETFRDIFQSHIKYAEFLSIKNCTNSFRNVTRLTFVNLQCNKFYQKVN